MNKGEILYSMYEEYQTCQKCPALCDSRQKVVFGAGKISADLMFIGGGPNAQEEEAAHPFVRKPGNILAEVLAQENLRYRPARGKQEGEYDIYISNTVLCRPYTWEEGKDGTPYKRDRPPTPMEIAECRDRLNAEIYTVDPKLLVLMGSAAASLVTHLSVNSVAGELFYLTLPGKIDGNEIVYPALVTWSPHDLVEGREHKKPGSDMTKFEAHIRRAASIVRVSKAYSKEVL